MGQKLTSRLQNDMSPMCQSRHSKGRCENSVGVVEASNCDAATSEALASAGAFSCGLLALWQSLEHFPTSWSYCGAEE